MPDPSRKIEIEIPVDFEAFVCAGVTKDGVVVTQGIGDDPWQACLILTLLQNFKLGPSEE